jgi:hypothetical protein
LPPIVACAPPIDEGAGQVCVSGYGNAHVPATRTAASSEMDLIILFAV